jgi:hypothetical protein
MQWAKAVPINKDKKAYSWAKSKSQQDQKQTKKQPQIHSSIPISRQKPQTTDKKVY